MDVRAIAEGRGAIDQALLAACEDLHRQLRPQLPPDYARFMQLVFEGGAGMAAAMADGRPQGVIVWRVYFNTSKGHRLYIDDLVVDEAARGTGVGKAMLGWAETKARGLGCDALDLDSGVQRTRAHRFYFREGFHISAYAFSKSLKTLA